ncbi:hypothetical protein ACFL02_09510 [Planctomycetota bacterium]
MGLEQYQEAADKLARQNRFIPPPKPKTETKAEPPGNCSAIFGDEALVGGKWVKVGDKVSEAVVLAVEPTRVTLRWEGRRITRAPVLVTNNRSITRGSSIYSNLDQGLGLSISQSLSQRNYLMQIQRDTLYQLYLRDPASRKRYEDFKNKYLKQQISPS